MEDIIVELPVNHFGHEDNVEEEDSMDAEDVGTESDSSSDEPHTPPKRIRRPPDRYSPASYNAVFVTTRL